MKLTYDVFGCGTSREENRTPPFASTNGTTFLLAVKANFSTTGLKPPLYTHGPLGRSMRYTGIRSPAYSKLQRKRPVPISGVMIFPIRTPLSKNLKLELAPTPDPPPIHGVISTFPF